MSTLNNVDFETWMGLVIEESYEYDSGPIVDMTEEEIQYMTHLYLLSYDHKQGAELFYMKFCENV